VHEAAGNGVVGSGITKLPENELTYGILFANVLAAFLK
jgi:hypothetical protein